MNPGGSVKDRAALGLVLWAEKTGKIQPGGTIVEGTAGNTGIGLAHVCRARGYKCVIYMPNVRLALSRSRSLSLPRAREVLTDPLSRRRPRARRRSTCCACSAQRCTRSQVRRRSLLVSADPRCSTPRTSCP